MTRPDTSMIDLKPFMAAHAPEQTNRGGRPALSSGGAAATEQPDEISYTEDEIVHMVAGQLFNCYSDGGAYGNLDSKGRKRWRDDAKALLALLSVTKRESVGVDDVARAVAESHEGRNWNTIPEFGRDWWRKTGKVLLAKYEIRRRDGQPC